MWVKEFVGAREFGFRRDDNLAYVGQTFNKYWRPYVRRNLDDNFRALEARANAKDAQWDADQWLDGAEAAA